MLPFAARQQWEQWTPDVLRICTSGFSAWEVTSD